MLDELRTLLRHKGYADAALLQRVRESPAATGDRDISELLHHMLLANRFWLMTLLGAPFVLEEEARRSPSFEALIARCRTTQLQEDAWLQTATETDMTRVLEHPDIPNGRCPVWQAFMQVCLHSQGHRAQCAAMLRRHGGAPPSTDFIVWLGDRRPPKWP